MEIFYKVLKDKVVEINDVKFEGSTDKFEFTTLEKFREFLNSSSLIVDVEAEEKLNEILEDISEVGNSNIQKYNIKHWVSNRSFGEIIDMYLSGEIIKPNMQREFVWNSAKCSRLIESIILGLPIPPFFLLEVEKNKYEIIDGYQRITTLVNYVNGLPWNFDIIKYIKEDEGVDIEEIKRKEKHRISKLSGNVLKEISNRTFAKLDKEYQRMIKRSTIPLIEFNQVTPGNFESKYLIFERINTGSDKLNAMQIRKSLAYGDFMENLYKNGNSCYEFQLLFANASLKKDVHIEAYLRVLVMVEIKLGRYEPEKSGIKNILNDYCEKNRNKIIEEEYNHQFNKAFNIIMDAFDRKINNLFKRPDVFGKTTFTGNLNVNILEAFMAILIYKIKMGESYNEKGALYEKYMLKMEKVVTDDLLNDDPSPFIVNPGSIEAIKKRLQIFSGIV